MSIKRRVTNLEQRPGRDVGIYVFTPVRTDDRHPAVIHGTPAATTSDDATAYVGHNDAARQLLAAAGVDEVTRANVRRLTRPADDLLFISHDR